MELSKKWLIIFVLILNGNPVMASSEIAVGLAGNFSEGSNSTNNQWGKYINPAVDLAFLNLKKSNPDLYHKIKLHRLDYAGKKEGVLYTIAEVQKKKLDVVIGYDQSAFAEIAASRLNELEIPMITHTATADTITKGRPYIFRSCFTNGMLARFMARYVKSDLELEYVITLPESTCLYCMDLAKNFAREFKKIGGKIIWVESTIKNGFNWSSIVDQFQVIKKTSGKNVGFLIPNHEAFSAKQIQYLSRVINNPLVIGGDGWGDKGDLFFKIVGTQKFQGYKFAHWVKNSNGQKSKEFTKQFKEKTGYDPVESSALMYDSMNAFFKAVESKENRIGSTSLLKAIQGLNGFEGVTGPIQFSGQKYHVKKPVVQKVIKAKFDVVRNDS